ncbi:MAG: peptide MFS transporter, partial [Pseudomonadota bacterium]
FAEMWERFSYYGMRALLIFYLTKHFLFTQDAAYGIYGAYTTLVYILPVIGGAIADRYLGLRKSVLVGAVLLVVGHGLMAIEGAPVQEGGRPNPVILNIFYLALTLIAMGVGFLKANISALVGELYEKTDQRRDQAFTLYYVGINLGSFGGALLAGYLGETFGWSYGFGLAGIGMLAGLIVFIRGKALLNGAGEPPNPDELAASAVASLSRENLIYIAAGALTLVVWFMIRDQGLVGLVLYAASAVTLRHILFRSVFTLEPEQRDRIFAALILIIVQVLFWALFEQAGSSLNIYADEQVDRTIFGQEVVASVFQSLNAMYIVLLGPFFAALWIFLERKGMHVTAADKFGLGIIQLGLGFLVLVWGDLSSAGLTPVIFIFLIYLLHTTGELCLSPVGLSAMTRLSVPSMVGLIMGTWFLATAFGNFVAAQIAQATAAPGASVTDVYSNVGWLAVGVGIALMVFSPFIRRMMHLDTLQDTDDVRAKLEEAKAKGAHYQAEEGASS